MNCKNESLFKQTWSYDQDAAMPIYGKNLSKISKTSRSVTCELIQHQGIGPCKVCSNDDLRLTLTYFTARSTLLPNAFVWENDSVQDFIETIEVYELKVGTNKAKLHVEPL